MAMGEEEPEGLNSGSLEDGPFQEHISHWVEVLERWVKRVDQGMGRREADADGSAGEGLGVEDPPLQMNDGVDLSKGC
jgi:hypothetical protein